MGNHKALARAIIDLLSNEEQLKEMGQRGRDFVVKNHAWKVIVDKLEATFQELIWAKKR